jgi:Mrp family chromosome partitioning ATPase
MPFKEVIKLSNNKTNENCNSNQQNSLIENNPNNNVKNVIAIMSGKGGVGKSTVSALLAKSLRKKGYQVGVLDADVTGPSIPRLLKVKDKKVGGSEFGMLPVEDEDGILVMSLNLFMDDEEQPVIWRGPIISGTVTQFWKDVFWGNLDYLIIDMPPGTGDVALTVMQTIPIDGMVMVSTPQDMVSMIVAKAVNMAKQLNIPIIGIVENMSYLICPDCNKKIRLFEDANLEDYLKRLDIELLGELPMSREIANLTREEVEQTEQASNKEMEEITEKIVKALSK